MKCNCTWTESVLAIIILVFTFWTTAYSTWVIAIAAILLLLHALTCKSCKNCDMGMAKSESRSRKRR